MLRPWNKEVGRESEIHSKLNSYWLIGWGEGGIHMNAFEIMCQHLEELFLKKILLKDSLWKDLICFYFNINIFHSIKINVLPLWLL